MPDKPRAWLVRWEAAVRASSPREAAERARALQLDRDRPSLRFAVVPDPPRKATPLEINLSETVDTPAVCQFCGEPVDDASAWANACSLCGTPYAETTP